MSTGEPNGGEKLRPILIVEDDHDVRELMSEMLGDEGFTVYAATGGEQALTMVAELDREPLILLDLYMPGMNGWTFLRELRKSGSLAKVIVTSAAPDAPQAIEAGATMFVAKPFSWETLIDAVNSVSGTTPATG